jgi:DNA-binding SARP family transcriptional activator
METIHIRLLGRLSIRRGGVEVQGIGSGKLLELLGYLLVHRSQPHSRDVLANLCWGDFTTVQSRKHLRQALWQLQSALNPDGMGAPPFFLADDGWVQVNPTAHCWLDVAEFEQRIAGARAPFVAGPWVGKQPPVGDGSPPAIGDELAAIGNLQAAADLYVGDLLEGCYADWCIFERERLQNEYLALLDRLAEWCVSHTQYERGLEYATKILHIDGTYERAHYQIMRLWGLSGNRAMALRQYDHCVRVLKAELDVGPSRATRELFERIRADTTPPPREMPTHPMAEVPDALRSEMLEGVRHLQFLLLDLFQQVSAQLQSMEQAIRDNRC